MAANRSNMFFPAVTEIDKLIKLVEDANYVEAKKYVEVNPALITAYTTCIVNNRSEKISPAKLAFKLCDTYMWKMFLEVICDVPVLLFNAMPTKLEKYKNKHIWVHPTLYFVNDEGKAEEKPIKHRELLEEFLKQASEQTEHYNIEPLLSAYSFAANTKRNGSDLIHGAYERLGALQDDMPKHLLKEFARKDSENTKSWVAWRETEEIRVFVYHILQDTIGLYTKQRSFFEYEPSKEKELKGFNVNTISALTCDVVVNYPDDEKPYDYNPNFPTKPKTLIPHPANGGLGKESIILIREGREGAYYHLHSERSNNCTGNPDRDLKNFCALWTVRTNDLCKLNPALKPNLNKSHDQEDSDSYTY